VIDDQFELGRLDDWQVSRLFAFEFNTAKIKGTGGLPTRHLSAPDRCVWMLRPSEVTAALSLDPSHAEMTNGESCRTT
jgi:hypothetical protein